MTRPLFCLTLCLVLGTACRTDKSPLEEVEPQPEVVDNDGDGFEEAEDCDDTNSAVHPDAEEICDEIDNDCDGETDEDVLSSFYADADGDGYGDPDSEVEACKAPSGHVENDGDCEDSDPDSYPEADERCDDVDNDCDGEVDEDLVYTWYWDADGDGYGDSDSAIESCDPASGYVADDTDCNDLSDDAFPGADEVCDGIDNDCDDEIDEDEALDASTWYADTDGDGHGDPDSATVSCTQPTGFVTDDTDCDDSDAAVSPVATEICDGVDNDCDGETDEDDAADLSTWYADTDADGYGDASASTESCNAPSGTVADDTDCDDSNAEIHPAATESCDEVDNDCDGAVDEEGAIGGSTWYADADSDGHGDADSSTESCSQPSGHVSDDTDCDDSDASVSPVATEICDEIDNDCDGETDEDEAADAATWFADTDGDGFGDAGDSTESCDQASGTVADDTDCDDENGDIHPEATEICDEIDNDCDGDIDDVDSSLSGAPTWYVDIDGDGYGSDSLIVEACEQPSSFVDNATDCDDGDATSSPSGTEICDEADNDCDGETDEDEATDVLTWYADADGDGYGDADSTDDGCEAPSGYVDDDTDCDDSTATAHPGADEICDEIDNDCDDEVDEDEATDAETWHADADGDGYGDADSTAQACEVPSGYVDDDTDCDDADDAIHPGAEDVCDEVDNDCDGETDEGSGGAETWYLDSDGDGYGDADSSVTSCEAPTGYVDDDTDCDDADDEISPAATEICDGIDNNCDGEEDLDEEVLGSSEACPAEDCQDLLGTLTTASDGNYWIDPTGSGDAFEIFCDLSTEGGGWTLVANIDDINDPWLLAQDDTWETTELRNETSLPSYSADISVTAKYESWTTIDVTDVYIYYKNDGASFLCEGLDLVDTLDQVFSTTPSSDECVSECSSWTDNRLDDEVESPVGLNCSDGNEGWMSSSSAENARIGGRSIAHSCCVMNAYAGAAGDRGFDTSTLNKTWASYEDGESEDNNILIFVR